MRFLVVGRLDEVGRWRNRDREGGGGGGGVWRGRCGGAGGRLVEGVGRMAGRRKEE